MLRFCLLSIFVSVAVIVQAQEEPVFLELPLQEEQQPLSLPLSISRPAGQGQAPFCFPEQGAQGGQKENHPGEQHSSAGISSVCWLFVSGFAGFLFEETFCYLGKIGYLQTGFIVVKVSCSSCSLDSIITCKSISQNCLFFL